MTIAPPTDNNVESPPKFTAYDYSNFYFGLQDNLLGVLEPFMEWYKGAHEAGYHMFESPFESAPTSHVKVRHQITDVVHDLINLVSYNYLGISVRPEVCSAAAATLKKYGLGASGSPILSGTFDLHTQLADNLARFKRKEAALIFPTGYSANIGFISALMRPGDYVVLDQFAHASIVDGALLARAKIIYFRHNNHNDLDAKLKRIKGRILVAVEGVYSMDGDICALPEIVDVCKKHKAHIMIDEAHSTFLFGKNGRGVAEHFGLEDEVDFHIGTFSKSLGGQGGFLCGSSSLIRYIRAFSHSRFFSCNLSPVIVAGLIEGLRISQEEPQLREKLWSNVTYLKNRLIEEGVNTGSSASQIIPALVNNDKKVFEVAEKIHQRGLYLLPATYPAVPRHQSRLRISVSSLHSQDELNTAATIIGSVFREEGISPS